MPWKVTPSNQQAYLDRVIQDGKAAICPRCGGEDLDYGELNFDGGGIIEHEVSCPDCDLEWYDCYRLEGIAEAIREGKA